MRLKKQTANYWWQQAMRIASVKEQTSKHSPKYHILDKAWWEVLDKYLEALGKELK